MHRFFSFAVLFNWLVVIAMIGLVGFGIGGEQPGLISGLEAMLSAESPFAIPAHIAKMISIAAALSVLTAGLWAIMAIMFADDSVRHNHEQDFVIATSLGYCLILFACVIAFSVGVGNHSIGALASIASLATVLAGVTQRVCAAEARSKIRNAKAGENSLSALRAQSMAAQSAKLASAGARTTRFVPKQPFSSYYLNQ